MYTIKSSSWIFLTIIIILYISFGISIIEGGKNPRSKPLGLNIDKIKSSSPKHDDENIIIKGLEKIEITNMDNIPHPPPTTIIVQSTKNNNNNNNNIEKEKEKINTTIEETFEILDTLEKDGTIINHKGKGTTVINKPTPAAFIGQIKELFLQIVRLFGFVPTSNKRKHRNMNFLNETTATDAVGDNNLIESNNNYYQEQVRTTVGAVLGRPDCINRAACRAGKYLKGIKGKEIILVIMEKVTPTKWQETYQVIKDSAGGHSADECHYKCLED